MNIEAAVVAFYFFHPLLSNYFPLQILTFPPPSARSGASGARACGHQWRAASLRRRPAPRAAAPLHGRALAPSTAQVAQRNLYSPHARVLIKLSRRHAVTQEFARRETQIECRPLILCVQKFSAAASAASDFTATKVHFPPVRADLSEAAAAVLLIGLGLLKTPWTSTPLFYTCLVLLHFPCSE